MKRRGTLTGLFVAALVFWCVGASRSSAQTNSTVALANGTAINAELTSSLDSKKAKAGDSVNARVSEAVKSGGTVVIPKGAKLVGHLTHASARSKGDPDSTLAILFDKAVLKSGQEMPVSLWIRAIAGEPRNNFQPGPQQDLNAGTPGAGPSPMGPGHTPVGAATPKAGVPPEAGSIGDDSVNSRGATAGGLTASGQLNPNSSGVFGMEGVRLMTDASKASQGSVITSNGKTVHLEGGTRLLLIAQGEASTSTK